MGNEVTHDAVLLSTKLKMPAPRRNYIARHELFAQLQRSSDVGVVYVMGAAGTGKTTLLSSYINESGYANTAWLSLDEANNNVVSFWHYFIAAVGNFLGGEREDILLLLRSNFDAARIESLITVVINRLCSDQDFYVVLDDIHCIKDQALIGTVDYFLKAMPQNLHIFMLSRDHPRFYLGEFAVSGQLLFMDGNQLRFSAEEGFRFLRDTLQLSASDETLSQMNDFAEGWIAGLQLVAAARGADKVFLRKAGNGIAADYLTREIFKLLGDAERRFLTVTCILTYFDEELCSPLLDGTDFQDMISKLMDRNLFITCIDEDKGIYRYHNILSEYLMQQFSALPRQAQVKYHQAAARILQLRGEHEEALRHLFTAEDYAGARLLLRSMKETVETWIYIDKLPLHELVSDINLAMQCLMYNISNLQLARTYEIGRALEAQYKGDEVLNGLHNLYPYINDTLDVSSPPSLMTFEQIEGLELSPVTESLLLIESANTLLSQKRYVQSEQFAIRALERIGGANSCMQFFGLSSQAQLLEETGRLNESLAVYARMETLLKSSTMMDALGYNYFVGSIGLYHKRMDEESARQALEATRRILHKASVPPSMVELGYEYHLAEYELLFGDAQKGAEIAAKMMEGYFSKDIVQLDRLLTSLYAQKRMEQHVVERYMQAFERHDERNRSLTSQLLYARMKADQGEVETAMLHTDNILAFSRGHQNRLRLVEASLLKIRLLTLSGSAQHKEINNCLREALHYAYENSILQPFFTERSVLGTRLEPYLVSMADHLNEGEQRFLQAAIKLYAGKAIRAKKEKGLLSERELQVLTELAKGLTNPEIAEQLCISLATVKTHIINIYGKLAVSSRIAAIEEANRRRLLRS